MKRALLPFAVALSMLPLAMPAGAHVERRLSVRFLDTNFDTNWQYRDPAVFRGEIRIRNFSGAGQQVTCVVRARLKTPNWEEVERDRVHVFLEPRVGDRPGSASPNFRIEFDRHVRRGQTFRKSANIPHCHGEPAPI